MRSTHVQFGPWTTTLHHGSRLELSAFWQRRLGRLGALATEGPRMHWWGTLAVGILAGALLLMPHLRMELTAAAEEQTAQPAATPVANRDEPFTATFSNGVKVQLIGLSTNPSKDQPWWAPDGTPLDEAPYVRVPAVMRTNQGQLPREICWRWINLPGDPDVATGWATDPHYCGAGGGRAFDADGKDVQGVNAWAVCIPNSPDTCTLRFSVSVRATPWSTVFSSDGHQVAMTRTHDGVREGAIFSVPTDAEAGTSITVSHKIPGQAVRLVAVDRTNRVHLASSAVGGGAIEFTQKTYRFADAVPGSIQRYELQSQTRQFDTIEFRNVSLHADKQSRVEIVRVAAGDAGQPQGARGGVLAEPVTGPQNRRELERAVRQALEKDDRYRLAAGELVKHVAPPFSKARDDFWSLMASPTRYGRFGDRGNEARRPGIIICGDSMSDVYKTLRNAEIGLDGPTLRHVLDVVFNLKGQEMAGDLQLLRAVVPGDWVISWDGYPDHVTSPAEIAVLERVLREKLYLNVSLDLHEVERPAYVARGAYKFTPIPRLNDGKNYPLDEWSAKREDGEFQIPLRRTNIGTNSVSFSGFLQAIGEVVLAPIVDEVSLPPKKEGFVLNHFGDPPQDYLAPFDEAQISDFLGSISRQTGLTFTKDTRSVMTLVITRDDVR